MIFKLQLNLSIIYFNKFFAYYLCTISILNFIVILKIARKLKKNINNIFFEHLTNRLVILASSKI